MFHKTRSASAFLGLRCGFLEPRLKVRPAVYPSDLVGHEALPEIEIAFKHDRFYWS